MAKQNNKHSLSESFTLINCSFLTQLYLVTIKENLHVLQAESKGGGSISFSNDKHIFVNVR